MSFLFDTCAVCEPASTEPNDKVIEQLDALPLEETFLSCVTIGEIQRGIARLDDGKKKRRLDGWLHARILPHYEGRIVPLDTSILLRWGNLAADLQDRGCNMPLLDSLIAATALVHNLTVVTRNEKDFGHCGVRVFNPWKLGA